MSEQPPPIPFPLNPIFNYSNWITATDGTLSIAQGDARYILKSGDNATGLIGFNAGLSSLFATISQNVNFGNSNVYINNDGSDNLVLNVPLSNSIQFQIPSGSNRLRVRGTDIQINGIPLYLTSANNTGFDSTTGGASSLTINANNTSGIIRFSVADGSGVISIPITINSANTTISNATTINNLSSSTQANNDNSTKVATTQYVGNMLATLPAEIKYMPYFYGETFNYANVLPALTQFGFDISNASTGNWGQNAYFTARVNFEQSFIQGANAPFKYFQSWSFLIDIYPSRLVTISTPNIYLLNGTINGNPNYDYNNITYAPTNRAYWTRNYINSSALAPSGNTPIPIYITQTASPSAQLIFNVLPPLTANPCVWRFSATCEIINLGNNVAGSGSVITSYNVSTAFVGGSSYTTF